MKKSRKDSKSTETLKQKAYKKFTIRLDVRGKVGDMWVKEFSRSNKYIAIIMRVLLIFFC